MDLSTFSEYYYAIKSQLKPKMSTEMLCMANLPVDCLEPIVRLLSAYDIGHLWLTGNFRLLYLLSEGGGVREFHFSHEPTYPLLWPRLMALFPHLTCFARSQCS